MVIGLGIEASLITVAILLLSLAGGYLNMLRFLSRFHLPPARFYANAMRGIERLEALSKETTDLKGQKLRVGSLQQGETGFAELVEALRENRVVKNDAQVIVLMLYEAKAGVRIGNISPEVVRALALLVARGNEATEEVVKTDPFDPNKATRELKQWVEAIARMRLVGWIVALVVIWLIMYIWLVCVR